MERRKGGEEERWRGGSPVTEHEGDREDTPSQIRVL